MFSETSARGLPTRALLFDAALMGIVVILNFFFEGRIFAVLLAIIVGTELITWAGICISHLNFRKRERSETFPAPIYPVANWVCIAFFVLVLSLMGILPEYRLGLATLTGWIIVLALISLTTQRSRHA